jgi:hypothetical protein
MKKLDTNKASEPGGPPPRTERKLGSGTNRLTKPKSNIRKKSK